MLGADQNSLLNVRVLLDTFSFNDSVAIEFYSHNGLVITGSREPHKKYFFKKLATINIADEEIRINQQLSESQVLRITPVDGNITFNGKTYNGTFFLYRTATGLDIINVLPLEDYIYCVLRTEGWPGWSKEVYKVFAIACRSYAIYQIRQARRQHKHYHIRATNAHQTYSGTHSCPVIKAAVEETEGIVLTYHKEPIAALYDACCGGIIPAHIKHGINFVEAPYLARTYPCTYCKGLKIFSWSKEIPLSTFKAKVRSAIPELESVDDINVTTDQAGVVQKVIITDDDQHYCLDGKKLYSLFPSVKSFAFTCTKKRNKIVLQGRGYGHHFGLCQWGAHELVNQGWHYKKILKFYYPETTFMKLYRKNSGAEVIEPQQATAESEQPPVHETTA